MIFVSVDVADHDSDPRMGIVDEAEDHTVDRRDDRLKLCCEHVGPVVEACAVRPAFHPVVVECGFPDHGERDRPLFPGVRERRDDVDVVGVDCWRAAR